MHSASKLLILHYNSYKNLHCLQVTHITVTAEVLMQKVTLLTVQPFDLIIIFFHHYSEDNSNKREDDTNGTKK